MAAGDRPLVPGPYEDAHIRRYLTPALYPPTLGAPTIDVRGPYAFPCSSVEGRFDLLEIEFGPSGEVLRLAAEVEQRCDGSPSTLRASIRVNSNPPFQPPPDSDADGVFDSLDDCIDTPNPDQANADGDLLGDACDDRFTRTLIAGRVRRSGYRAQPTMDILDTRDGAFRVQAVAEGIEVRYAGAASIRLRFGSGVYGKILQPGVYEDASDGGIPYASFSGWPVCQYARTRFEVHELELSPTGRVVRFSVDFALLCDPFVGGPAIGGVRFEASDSAPGPEDFDEDGVPDIADNCRGATNPDQIDSDADFAGDVCDESLAATFVLLDSPLGDFVGRGLRQLFTNPDDPIIPLRDQNIGVSRNSVSFDGLDNELGRWRVRMAAPYAATLVAGSYVDAQRFPFHDDDRPGLDASGAGYGCGTLTGRFDVFEASYTPSGHVERFSADFEQFCGGGSPLPLVGSVRFRSAFVPAAGDGDGDGVLDEADNCPDTANPTQTDGNQDGRGDECTRVRIEIEPKWPFAAVLVGTQRPVRVALLGSEAVDVRDLVWEGLAFGPGRAKPLHRPQRRDVDRDGFDDLLAFFDLEASQIALGDLRACVSGSLAGQYFLACDAIFTHAPGCGRGAELALLAPIVPWLRRRAGSRRRAWRPLRGRGAPGMSARRTFLAASALALALVAPLASGHLEPIEPGPLSARRSRRAARRRDPALEGQERARGIAEHSDRGVDVR